MTLDRDKERARDVLQKSRNQNIVFPSEIINSIEPSELNLTKKPEPVKQPELPNDIEITNKIKEFFNKEIKREIEILWNSRRVILNCDIAILDKPVPAGLTHIKASTPKKTLHSYIKEWINGAIIGLKNDFNEWFINFTCEIGKSPLNIYYLWERNIYNWINEAKLIEHWLNYLSTYIAIDYVVLYELFKLLLIRLNREAEKWCRSQKGRNYLFKGFFNSNEIALIDKLIVDLSWELKERFPECVDEIKYKKDIESGADAVKKAIGK